MFINSQPFNIGLIGNPVIHSRSPLLHQGFLEEYNLKGSYSLFQPAEDELLSYIEHLRLLKFAGINITVPYKTSLLHYPRTLSPEAQAIGAINTLIFSQDNSIIGHNTDCQGFWDSLVNNYPRKHYEHIIIIGAGGSARSIISAFLLFGEGKAKSITVLTKNQDTSIAKAHNLIQDLNTLRVQYSQDTIMQVSSINSFHIKELDLLYLADILINTSPIGMSYHPLSPVPIEFLQQLNPNALVYDLIYEPDITPLLDMASNLGLTTINGSDMLYNQARLSFLAWMKGQGYN